MRTAKIVNKMEISLQVRGQIVTGHGGSVAGAGDGRCRWREKTSQVCVFGPNCDVNRH